MVNAAPAAATSKRPVSYRALGWFWIAIGTLVVAGGITLQALGPVAPAIPPASNPPHVQLPAPSPNPARPTHTIPPPDPALLEAAPADVPDVTGRFLPQVASDGRSPASVYAAPYDKSDKHPHVALVISGAGLDQDQTLHLLNDLPGAVDVAFSAYMPEDRADPLAAVARTRGHECLVSIPMEPNGFPLVDEGPKALLSSGPDDEQKREHLVWALSRLGGCVGATGASDGMLGERFAQTDTSFSDLLTEINRRGLLYLDPRTGAPALLTNSTPNIRVVDVVVDQSPNPETPVTADMIDQRLSTLTQDALLHGSAIGLAGPPKPMVLERVQLWVNQLAARGVTLVPLTATASATGPAADSSGQ